MECDIRKETVRGLRKRKSMAIGAGIGKVEINGSSKTGIGKVTGIA